MPLDMYQETSAAFRAHILKYDGVKEIKGPQDNPQIVAWAHKAGIDWVVDDETPWCASSMNGWLAEMGLPGTGSAMARSFENWGQEVKHPIPGDLVVMWRGSPNSASGHITTFVRFGPNGTVICFGGNQGDMVKESSYSIDKVLSYRRWDGRSASDNRPLLKLGKNNDWVRLMQVDLAKLGYFSGTADGDFGPLTEAAVMEFQSRMDLTTDGVWGMKSWAALDKAQENPTTYKKPKRAASASSLRKAGSRSVTTADLAQGTALLGTSGISLASVVDSVDKIEHVANTSIVQTYLAAAQDNVTVIVIAAVVLGVVWWAMHKNKAARVEDAQDGKNLSR